MQRDQDTDRRALEALTHLVRAREAQRNAAAIEQRSRADLALLGYAPAAVDIALNAMETGIRARVEDRRQAQTLLSALRSPVQIELAEYYETADALTDGRKTAIAYDEGWHAFVTNRSRTCKAPDEQTRAAWFKGWDDARAAMGERGD